MATNPHRREDIPIRGPKSAKPAASKMEAIKTKEGNSQERDKTKLYPVPPDDPIFAVWTKVLDKILSRISLKDICMIGCLRLASSSNPTKHCTTIVITYTSNGRPKHLELSERVVQNILASFNLHKVMIKASRGRFFQESYYTTGDLDPKVFQQPMLGQSLAVNTNTWSAGTLGGFFEIKLPGLNKWNTVALTCFHCIDPRECDLDDKLKDSLRRCRRLGLRPTDPLRFSIPVRHPCESAIEKKKDELKDDMYLYEKRDEFSHCLAQVERGDGEHMSSTHRKSVKDWMELREQLRRVHRFQEREQHAFGCVLAGSGYRVTQLRTISGRDPDPHTYGSNLDWALIDMPEHRLDVNRGSYEQSLYDSPMPDISEGLPVCKLGQRSGFTTGTYNPLVVAHIWAQFVDGRSVHRCTKEHNIIIGDGRLPFSQKGDSGSLVFTNEDPEHRVLLGMLFGGIGQCACKTCSHGVWCGEVCLSYFTHIDDILEDIKSLTGASDVRLKTNNTRGS